MRYFAIVLLLVASASVFADAGVDITDPGQIATLMAIQKRVDALSTTIKSCMRSGQEHQACMCEHKRLLIEFKKSVKDLFVKYPEFKKRDLVRFNDKGSSVAQSILGFRKQAATKLVCDE